MGLASSAQEIWKRTGHGAAPGRWWMKTRKFKDGLSSGQLDRLYPFGGRISRTARNDFKKLACRALSGQSVSLDTRGGASWAFVINIYDCGEPVGAVSSEGHSARAGRGDAMGAAKKSSWHTCRLAEYSALEYRARAANGSPHLKKKPDPTKPAVSRPFGKLSRFPRCTLGGIAAGPLNARRVGDTAPGTSAWRARTVRVESSAEKRQLLKSPGINNSNSRRDFSRSPGGRKLELSIQSPLALRRRTIFLAVTESLPTPHVRTHK